MPARSLNKVMLIGNLTRDPNLRYTPNGTAVCSFGMATNRSWVSGDGGEKQERVDFHNIVAWSKLADICGQLLHKGDKVYAEGRMQTRDWKADDGSDRRTTEVIIDNMILLRSARSSGASSGEDAGGSDEYTAAPAAKTGLAGTTGESTHADSADLPIEEAAISDAQQVADDIPF